MGDNLFQILIRKNGEEEERIERERRCGEKEGGHSGEQITEYDEKNDNVICCCYECGGHYMRKRRDMDWERINNLPSRAMKDI